MKKLLASVVLMALASVAYAGTNLGLDVFCNSSGTFKGIRTFNNTYYLHCDLPTPIAINDIIVLAKNSSGPPFFAIV
ncbi:hypothetical protein [Microbulbifer sp. 2205BS26-8]|uniref:hypothetical protein n=1 Tax=Microbulbifer sp. 2205BS26-8 TaxID=3064386 RepID=UPI00273F457E|nr:hypothetical protein [Microbulbifer sp. 2205BS26-8]MDP5210166.1 hypothetical protein [Microbulbifer sp. 2205BS26-8]